MSRRVAYALPAAVAASLLATGCGSAQPKKAPKPAASVTTTAPRTTQSAPRTTVPQPSTATKPPTTTERGGLGGGSNGGSGS
ncbi:hypothetical protein [Nocardia sp. NPDC050793]|uniref:hypothetical protein n=1 Tax=Nocardia sp. NPDC050793 TaxID=3155159 RepID=UPI0033DB23BD